MGEARRRELNGEPAQPIPAEKLRELYPDLLEVELVGVRLQLEQSKLREMAQAFQSKVQALGVNQAEWRVDYKSGKMTRLVPVAEPSE